jgi:hypothetical protein
MFHFIVRFNYLTKLGNNNASLRRSAPRISLHRNLAAEILKSLHKATDGFGAILAVEVLAAEVCRRGVSV